MTLFSNLEIQNVIESEVVIGDLQLTIPVEGSVTLQGKVPEDVSRSEDLVSAIVTDKVVVFDTIQNIPLSTMAAVSLIASGGGNTFVNLDGVPRVHASPRPLDSLTYFTSAGDDLTSTNPFKVKGYGERLLFNIKSTDKSKHIDLVFDEEIQIKDGFMICTDAPFGACIDVEIVIPAGHPAGHPQIELTVARFANKIPLLNNGWFPMDSADGGQVFLGMIVRVRVNNAMGNETFDSGEANPDYDPRQDPPASFKVAGRLEIFRSKTVFLPR